MSKRSAIIISLSTDPRNIVPPWAGTRTNSWKMAHFRLLRNAKRFSQSPSKFHVTQVMVSARWILSFLSDLSGRISETTHWNIRCWRGIAVVFRRRKVTRRTLKCRRKRFRSPALWYGSRTEVNNPMMYRIATPHISYCKWCVGKALSLKCKDMLFRSAF